MIKSLLKAILVVLCLLMLIPLVLLLIGEGALVGKIFNISLPEKHEKTEIVERHDGSAIVTDNDGNISVTQSINGLSYSENGAVQFIDMKVHPDVAGQDGGAGIRVDVKFKVNNLANNRLYCMVRFYDANGDPLKNTSGNKQYTSINGNIISGCWVVPTASKQTMTESLFLPHTLLPRPAKGNMEYLLDVSILHYSSQTDYEVIYRSDVSSVSYDVN